jgi:2,3-bisphosphoglycerate-dependent phosphoglycerate mutase
LLLKHFDSRLGFATWQSLTNPDVFLVTLAADGASIERLWQP